MATDIDYDVEFLDKAITDLHSWFKFQSYENRNNLYNTASKLFKSDFNPAEYDDVE